MFLVYVDDSGDEDRVLLSALAIPDRRWNGSLRAWLTWRKTLQHQHRLPVTYEIHSQEWLSASPEVCWDEAEAGLVAITTQGRDQRRLRFDVFEKCLKTIGSLADVQLLTLYRQGSNKFAAYDGLLAWIEDFLQEQDARATIILDGLDQGFHYRACHRALKLAKRRILEDPTERKSCDSQFVQMADVCVHAAFQSVAKNEGRDLKVWGWYQNYLQRVIVQDGSEVDSRGIRGLP